MASKVLSWRRKFPTSIDVIESILTPDMVPPPISTEPLSCSAILPNPRLFLAVEPDSATQASPLPTIKFPSAEVSPTISSRPLVTFKVTAPLSPPPERPVPAVTPVISPLFPSEVRSTQLPFA